MIRSGVYHRAVYLERRFSIIFDFWGAHVSGRRNLGSPEPGVYGPEATRFCKPANT